MHMLRKAAILLVVAGIGAGAAVGASACGEDREGDVEFEGGTGTRDHRNDRNRHHRHGHDPHGGRDGDRDHALDERPHEAARRADRRGRARGLRARGGGDRHGGLVLGRQARALLGPLPLRRGGAVRALRGTHRHRPDAAWRLGVGALRATPERGRGHPGGRADHRRRRQPLAGEGGRPAPAGQLAGARPGRARGPARPRRRLVRPDPARADDHALERAGRPG